MMIRRLTLIGLCSQALLSAGAEPFAGLHRDWATALAVPARYAFTNKVEFVKTWRFDDYDVEFYRQANGPGTSQRVFVSLPKKREGRCPAVVVPFYFPEAMLGFDPETGEKLPKLPSGTRRAVEPCDRA